jgi:hypothetical protein
VLNVPCYLLSDLKCRLDSNKPNCTCENKHQISILHGGVGVQWCSAGGRAHPVCLHCRSVHKIQSADERLLFWAFTLLLLRAIWCDWYTETVRAYAFAQNWGARKWRCWFCNERKWLSARDAMEAKLDYVVQLIDRWSGNWWRTKGNFKARWGGNGSFGTGNFPI